MPAFAEEDAGNRAETKGTIPPVPVVTREIECNSPEATERIGEWLGERVSAGTVFDLRGSLGTGKTRFVHGLARGLGVRESPRSPTFTICHIHEGRCRLFHLDLYRLGDPSELLLQGWDEMRSEAVVAVEWGERAEALYQGDRITILFEHRGPRARRLTLRTSGKQYTALVASLPASTDAGTVAENK